MKKMFKFISVIMLIALFVFNVRLVVKEGSLSFNVEEVSAQTSPNPICWNWYTRGGQLSKIVCDIVVAGENEHCKTVNDISTYGLAILCYAEPE